MTTKKSSPSAIDIRAREAVQAIRDAANEAVTVLAGAAEAAAKKVIEASSDGPKRQLADAAREAATSISVAAKDAAQTLAGAAKDASKVVALRADTGEDWDQNRKLVMSELGRLNTSLKEGLAAIADTFQSHANEDTVRFTAMNGRFDSQDRAHSDLKADLATITERVESQLWTMYGSAFAALVAILFTLGFHYLK